MAHGRVRSPFGILRPPPSFTRKSRFPNDDRVALATGTKGALWVLARKHLRLRRIGHVEHAELVYDASIARLPWKAMSLR